MLTTVFTLLISFASTQKPGDTRIPLTLTPLKLKPTFTPSVFKKGFCPTIKKMDDFEPELLKGDWFWKSSIDQLYEDAQCLHSRLDIVNGTFTELIEFRLEDNWVQYPRVNI